MAFIDTTSYGAVHPPDPQLGNLFAQHDLPSDIRVALCRDGFYALELWHALGDTPGPAITALTDATTTVVWPDAGPGREMLKIRLRAVFQGCANFAKGRLDRVQKLEEDPSKLPSIPDQERVQMRLKWNADHSELPLTVYTQPHDRFLDRLRRDFLLQGRVPLYALSEVRVKNDTIIQTSGFRGNVHDLLQIGQQDDKASITSSENALNRIRSLYTAIAMLNIMPATITGSLGFCNDLGIWSTRHPGLDMIMALDHLWRTRIDDYLNDHPEADFKLAFDHVRNHDKWLWDSALVSVGMERVSRRNVPDPGGGNMRLALTDTPIKESSSARRRRLKRDRDDRLSADGDKRRRADDALDEAAAGRTSPRGGSGGDGKRKSNDGRGSGRPHSGDKGKGDGKGKKGKSEHPIVDKKEWSAVLKRSAAAGMKQGKGYCRFAMTTAGCTKGDACHFLHECPDCPGQHHSWARHHHRG